jgi:hypothetical protein
MVVGLVAVVAVVVGLCVVGAGFKPASTATNRHGERAGLKPAPTTATNRHGERAGFQTRPYGDKPIRRTGGFETRPSGDKPTRRTGGFQTRPYTQIRFPTNLSHDISPTDLRLPIIPNGTFPQNAHRPQIIICGRRCGAVYAKRHLLTSLGYG